MKPEESHSARDTLCRLEEELINLEDLYTSGISSVCHRFQTLGVVMMILLHHYHTQSLGFLASVIDSRLWVW